MNGTSSDWCRQPLNPFCLNHSVGSGRLSKRLVLLLPGLSDKRPERTLQALLPDTGCAPRNGPHACPAAGTSGAVQRTTQTQEVGPHTHTPTHTHTRPHTHTHTPTYMSVVQCTHCQIPIPACPATALHRGEAVVRQVPKKRKRNSQLDWFQVFFLSDNIY